MSCSSPSDNSHRRPSAHLPLPPGLYNWAAPEVIRRRPCTGKADLYSLCALIQELYTGSYSICCPLQQCEYLCDLGVCVFFRRHSAVGPGGPSLDQADCRVGPGPGYRFQCAPALLRPGQGGPAAPPRGPYTQPAGLALYTAPRHEGIDCSLGTPPT